MVAIFFAILNNPPDMSGHVKNSNSIHKMETVEHYSFFPKKSICKSMLSVLISSPI